MEFGMLCWGETKGVERVRLLEAPFWKITVPYGKSGRLRRLRLRIAAGKLKRLGVTQAVLPENFSYRETLENVGIFPVSTLALRREIAADWAMAAGREGSSAAVRADAMTPEVVRTVTELSLRRRYILLSVPRGGEELARRLRREYGVSLELARNGGELEGAGAVAAFSPAEGIEHPLVLRIYDETQPMPELSLPMEIASQIPRGVCREQFLAVLREAGVLRKGEMSFACRA